MDIADRHPEERSLQVSYRKINEFDAELAGFLLQRFYNAHFLAEKVIENLTPPDKKVHIHIRIVELPKDSKLEIRDIRSKHLGNFIAVEGLVRRATEVRPKLKQGLFRCMRCNTLIKEPQDNLSFKEPLECYKDQNGCGRTPASTRFKLLADISDYVDTQKIEIQELPEGLRGGAQPQRLQAFAEDDITGDISPGDRIILNGMLRSIPQRTHPIRNTIFDIFLDINSVELQEYEFEEIEISKEEEEKIIEMSQDLDIYGKITASISPTIYGLTYEKEALALQLFGGVPKILPDGTHIRGDIHLFLVGDPGTAKSQLLRYISELAPRGIYASGKSSSAAGLTAAAVKDEFGEGRWTLEAGALVLSDKGMCCLLPDSQIIANNEIVPISSLFLESKKKTGSSNGEIVEIMELDCLVASIDRSYFKSTTSKSTLIRRKWYEGKVLELNMQSGFSIKLTPDHQLLDGNSVRWKPASEFSTSDFILSLLKLPNNSEELYILDMVPDNWLVFLNKKEKEEIKSLVWDNYGSFELFNRKYGLHNDILSGRGQMKVGAFRSILRKFGCYDQWRNRNLKYGRKIGGERLKVSRITPELSYFLGFIYGDGCVQVNKKHSNINIYQSQIHTAQIEQLKSMFSGFSYRELGEYKLIRRSKIRGENVVSKCSTFYTSSNLLGFLYNFFTTNNLGNILRLPDECLNAFVAGALDSDGCISIKKGRKGGKAYETVHVEFLLSNTEEENKNFMMALRRMDCYSRLIKGQAVHKIRITGRNDARRLIEQLKKHSVKVKEIPIRKTKISSTSEKAPIIPTMEICNELSKLHTPTLLKQGIWSTIHTYKNGKRQPSKIQLRKIKNRLEGIIQKELCDKIDSLAANDYFLDKVVAIKEGEYNGYVYDLYVPINHNFMSEGLIVHNCIDELDKMTPQDRSSMHEAMEQQRISIAKAGITATLQSRCAILGAANPKFGRFHTRDPMALQINIPPTLLSRFDIIFVITDIPDSSKDTLIADHILKTHKIGGAEKHEQETGEKVMSEEEMLARAETIDRDLFRKYVAYAKKNSFPVLTEEASDVLRSFYIDVRKQGELEDAPVPITARQLEALVRLSEASARMRLANEVSKDDANRATRLVEYYLRKVAGEEGRFDIDIIESGIAKSQRERIIIVREIIKRLGEGGEVVDREDILEEAEVMGVDRSRAASIIDKLNKEEGFIYTPNSKPGKYRLA